MESHAFVQASDYSVTLKCRSTRTLYKWFACQKIPLFFFFLILICKCRLFYKVLKLELDCSVQPRKPQTIQLYGLFRVKNRSMQKKQEPARTTVRLLGFWGSDGLFSVSAFPVNFCQYTDMKLWSDLEEMKEYEEEQRSEGDLIISDLEQRDL